MDIHPDARSSTKAGAKAPSTSTRRDRMIAQKKSSAKAAPKIERAFWDTSAIVTLCRHQDTSQEMRPIARRSSASPPSGARRRSAERAQPRLVHDGKMTARGLKQAATRLEVHHVSWIEVLPSDRVREITGTLPEHYGLRALDSFQLAAAHVWCKEQPRGRLFVC